MKKMYLRFDTLMTLSHFVGLAGTWNREGLCTTKLEGTFTMDQPWILAYVEYMKDQGQIEYAEELPFPPLQGVGQACPI